MTRLPAPLSSVLAITLVGSAIALVGCSLPPSLVRPQKSPIAPLPQTPVKISPQSTDRRSPFVDGHINGIDFRLWGTDSVTMNFVNQGVYLQAGANRIVIDQQRIYLNGYDRGFISPPATLLLDAQGRLFVNGELRS